MGYGISRYGLSAYGGIASTITVAAGYATTTHQVRVVLSAPPLHVDQFSAGDATNPLTWTVADASGRQFTIAIASMHDDVSVDLTTLEPLGDDQTEHTVTAIGLLSAESVSATSPLSATFLGVVQTSDPVDAANLDFRDRDLANPPFQVSRGLGYAGTLQIGADGDFVNESGRALTRKLVLRRMNTPRGAFRHLPLYGVADLVKEPVLSGGDLVARLREYEQQARQEPDVTSARATGSLDRSGVLIVLLAITTTGGANINMRMGQHAGRLVEI
jgi:hypothetical protein